MQVPAESADTTATPGPASRRVVSSLRTWLAAAPSYPPAAADVRTVSVLGLPLPVRATVALLVVTGVMLLDYHGRIDDVVRAVTGPLGPSVADAQRLTSLSRLLVEGLVPLLVVLVAFRDRPSRYGLQLGAWRAGLGIAVAGCAVMTPIVIGMVMWPPFAGYYAPQATHPLDVALTTAIEVIPAEFFFRGFLLFTLLRVIGPIAVVVATLPFAFVHLGKPEIETLSTLAGGIAYGWLDWRTGSVLWSGLAHTWILSLAVIAAGIATGATA
jgi:membrane protease YdiL (CAAX protease family)